MTTRRRPMERIGDLLPETARRLGLEDELRLVRAAGTWAAIVAEHGLSPEEYDRIFMQFVLFGGTHTYGNSNKSR